MEKYDKLIELVDDLNLPKHFLKKSEELLKAFFGPSVADASGLISDQVKLRRFKNQITILERAQGFIKEKGIDPKKLNLKVLAPLIEYSSLEENETLQEKWAKLIANTLTEDRQIRLEQNCVNIMSKISVEEAISLDKLLELAYKMREERFNKYQTGRWKPKNINTVEDINLTNVYLSEKRITEHIKINSSEMEVLINGLESLAVIKWETPDVEVSATKNNEEPSDLDIDIDVNVHEPSGIYLTRLGIDFIKICEI
jgi:hypothetical protein